MHKNLIGYCQEYNKMCENGKAPKSGAYSMAEFMQIYDFITEKHGGVNVHSIFEAINTALEAGYVTGYKAAERKARKKLGKS